MDVVEYNLKYSIPENVGLRFSGKGRAKELLLDDVPQVLASIFEKIEKEKQKNDSQIINLNLKGIASKQVLMALAAGIARREDVNHFFYTEPYGLGSKICEGVLYE